MTLNLVCGIGYSSTTKFVQLRLICMYVISVMWMHSKLHPGANLQTIGQDRGQRSRSQGFPLSIGVHSLKKFIHKGSLLVLVCIVWRSLCQIEKLYLFAINWLNVCVCVYVCVWGGGGGTGCMIGWFLTDTQTNVRTSKWMESCTPYQTKPKQVWQ